MRCKKRWQKLHFSSFVLVFFAQNKIVSNSRFSLESVALILLLTPDNSRSRRLKMPSRKECICYTFYTHGDVSSMWFRRRSLSSGKIIWARRLDTLRLTQAGSFRIILSIIVDDGLTIRDAVVLMDFSLEDDCWRWILMIIFTMTTQVDAIVCRWV